MEAAQPATVPDAGAMQPAASSVEPPATATIKAEGSWTPAGVEVSAAVSSVNAGVELPKPAAINEATCRQCANPKVRPMAVAPHAKASVFR